MPYLGCLSIQRYGACCIKPLEAGAAVLVHRGFVWIAPAKQAPFVDWMQRVDKHVRAVKRNPRCDATIAESRDNVSFGSASKAGSVSQAGNSLRSFSSIARLYRTPRPSPGTFRIRGSA